MTVITDDADNQVLTYIYNGVDDITGKVKYQLSGPIDDGVYTLQ